MHLHILTSIEPKKFINSNIASDRLRLNYLYSAAKELGYNVTGSLNIQKNADIYYVGKINIDMIDKILEILSDKLISSTHPMFPPYLLLSAIL